MIQGYRFTRDDGKVFDLITGPIGKRRGSFLFGALGSSGLVALALPPDETLAWEMAGGRVLPGPVGLAALQARDP